MDSVILTANRGGTLTLGSQSITEVQLETAGENEARHHRGQQPSAYLAGGWPIGEQITMEGGARIIAPHGDVTLAACSACGSITDNTLAKVKELATEVSVSSRRLEHSSASGALIDVSGATLAGADALSVDGQCDQG